MQHINTSGNGLIGIDLRDSGSYLRFDDRPQVMILNECGDPFYACLIPGTDAFRAVVNETLSGIDTRPLSDKETLVRTLEPLFSVLSNGNYFLYTYDDVEIFWRNCYPDANAGTSSLLIDLVFPKLVELQRTKEVAGMINKGADTRPGSQLWELVGCSTSDIYESFFESDNYTYNDTESLIATRPQHSEDAKIIAEYESRILAGERPIVLLLSAHSTEKYDRSPKFILDGHNKLRAYRNVSVKPRLLLLSHHQDPSEQRFNAAEAAEVLYPWLIEFLIMNSADKTSFIQVANHNPESPLAGLIRNGFIRLFHSTGELYSEAFYKDHAVEGLYRSWYRNGNRESEYYVEDGRINGVRKNWHEAGWLRESTTFKKGIQQGPSTEYHENGQKIRESFYENGRHRDGSHFCWNEEGDLTVEFIYQGGRQIEQKTFSPAGELIRHFVYDELIKRMVPHETQHERDAIARRKEEAEANRLRLKERQRREPTHWNDQAQVRFGCLILLLMLATMCYMLYKLFTFPV